MKNYRVLSFVFLVLAGTATVYAPYSWGDERLQTEVERSSSIISDSSEKARDLFPVKRYALLFGNSKHEFDFKVTIPYKEPPKDSLKINTSSGNSSLLDLIGSRTDQTKKISVTLERRLLGGELVLEYVVAFALAFIVHLLCSAVSRGKIRTGGAQQNDAAQAKSSAPTGGSSAWPPSGSFPWHGALFFAALIGLHFAAEATTRRSSSETLAAPSRPVTTAQPPKPSVTLSLSSSVGNGNVSPATTPSPAASSAGGEDEEPYKSGAYVESIRKRKKEEWEAKQREPLNSTRSPKEAKEHENDPKPNPYYP